MREALSIPGLPHQACQRLIDVLQQSPKVQEVWLFGSRAMGRHREGSDLDLCLVGEAITHLDRQQLMHAIDELLLPWPVDLALRHEMPDELLAHLSRVGRCLWRRTST